jgi:hypothetical protein
MMRRLLPSLPSTRYSLFLQLRTLGFMSGVHELFSLGDKSTVFGFGRVKDSRQSEKREREFNILVIENGYSKQYNFEERGGEECAEIVENIGREIGRFKRLLLA